MSTKIDLQKAYDSVHLDFLLHFLDKYGFLDLIRGWIKACIWNATFTININGSNVGFFRGMHGLHQGCPMTLYLVVIVMQHLCNMLNNAT